MCKKDGPWTAIPFTESLLCECGTVKVADPDDEGIIRECFFAGLIPATMLQRGEDGEVQKVKLSPAEVKNLLDSMRD
jgi:hypothetical protein